MSEPNTELHDAESNESVVPPVIGKSPARIQLGMTRKEIPWAIFALTCLAYSTVEGLHGEDAGLMQIADLFICIANSICTLCWCHFDAAQRSFRISRLFSVIIFLFGLIVLPVYLLRTRGVRGLLSIVIAVALFVLLSLICALNVTVVESMPHRHGPLLLSL